MRPCLKIILALFVVGMTTGNAALAQEYPTRPIRWIVLFPPGGGSDIVSRMLAQRMSPNLGQQIVVDNRTGASGVIGSEIIAKANPDGYTIGLIISSHAVNPALFKKLPYDSVRDFEPITLIGYGLFALVVHPSVPAKSLKDLIALAKSQPGKLNAAVASTGTVGHLALEQMKTLYQLDITSVLYKGAGPAVIDTLGGQVQIMFASYPSVQPFIKAGKLRALAVTSAKRSAAAPELPTAAELGFAGLDLSDWWGLVAPAETNKAIIRRLNAETTKALAQPDIREKLVSMGADVVGSSPEEFGTLIRTGIDRWGKIVRDAGIKPE
ncbi:MAG TPA: tripartite tricarboxylate transporter substrate binding protein [Reyranella sp.]|nr:tripartite tricarboxylate transporter substrate binding protein [Reyranella sp.]